MRRVGPVYGVPPASVDELEAMLVAIVEVGRRAAIAGHDGSARNERVIDAEVYLLRRGLVEPTFLHPVIEGTVLARREYARGDGPA